MAFEVRNPEIETRLNQIGSRLRSTLEGTGYGFTLLIFSFGEGGDMFYTSNANRQDVCNAMREFIAKHEPN
jgi:hypothetical protein